MSAPNGFDGMWNPICPFCGGYMHTGHTSDCPVTRSRDARMQKLVDLVTRLRGGVSPSGKEQP